MTRTKKELDSTDKSSVSRKVLKETSGKCSFCPWHDGENRGDRPKHTPKPKKNDKRSR